MSASGSTGPFGSIPTRVKPRTLTFVPVPVAWHSSVCWGMCVCVCVGGKTTANRFTFVIYRGTAGLLCYRHRDSIRVWPSSGGIAGIRHLLEGNSVNRVVEIFLEDVRMACPIP